MCIDSTSRIKLRELSQNLRYSLQNDKSWQYHSRREERIGDKWLERFFYSSDQDDDEVVCHSPPYHLIIWYTICWKSVPYQPFTNHTKWSMVVPMKSPDSQSFSRLCRQPDIGSQGAKFFSPSRSCWAHFIFPQCPTSSRFESCRNSSLSYRKG